MFLMLGLWGCNQQGSLEDSLAPDPGLSQQPAVLGNDAPTTNLPKDFPSEIPIYPNATLIQSEPNSTVWAIADNVTQLETFYRDKLAAENWSIVPSESTANNFIQLVATKDNIEISLALPTASAPAAEDSDRAVVGTTFVLNYQLLDSQPELNGDNAGTGTEPADTATEEEKKGNATTNNTDPSQMVKDLEQLGVFTAQDYQPDEVISRRQFARWLLQAHNAIYGDRQNQQIRLANNASKPVFSDVPTSDPDFDVIQGLAEAGFIPSSLTNDTSTLAFRPDAPLTRETLVAWKVPLDRRQALPKTTLDQIDETWGFQDAAKVDTRALQALYIDFQNDDKSNVRRLFGYTTLFQPKKSVTQKEAAIAISYFGFQGDGLSAAEALPQP